MPKRVGIMHAADPRNYSRRELIALVRRADELGYSAFWLPESWGRDAFSVLTEAAVLTKHIQLGTSVVTVWARSPANTAQAIASLDEVSEGRARLGLGITGPIVVEDWHGLKWEKPFRRCREYVDIIRLAIAGERVNYEGEIFRLRNFKLAFAPPRQRIPIYIGAFGPKNVRSAGTYADGWVATEESPRYFGELLRELVAGVEGAHRSRSAVDASYCVPALAVAEDDATAKELREIYRRTLAFEVAGLGLFHGDAVARQGFAAEVAAIRERWVAGDRAGATELVTEAMIDAIAIIASPAEARRRLEEYRAQGADEVCFGFPYGISFEARMRTLEAMAP